MNRVSKIRAPQNREYTKVKRTFLLSNQICFRCGYYTAYEQRTVHHFFGRTRALLCWVPGFRMACLPCHRFIETHRNDSVAAGLRAPNNLFNRPSLVIPK